MFKIEYKIAVQLKHWADEIENLTQISDVFQIYVA